MLCSSVEGMSTQSKQVGNMSNVGQRLDGNVAFGLLLYTGYGMVLDHLLRHVDHVEVCIWNHVSYQHTILIKTDQWLLTPEESHNADSQDTQVV